jgi:hypothetical protein
MRLEAMTPKVEEITEKRRGARKESSQPASFDPLLNPPFQKHDDEGGSGSFTRKDGRRSRRLVTADYLEHRTCTAALLTMIGTGTRESSVQVVPVGYEDTCTLGNGTDDRIKRSS